MLNGKFEEFSDFEQTHVPIEYFKKVRHLNIKVVAQEANFSRRIIRKGKKTQKAPTPKFKVVE